MLLNKHHLLVFENAKDFLISIGATQFLAIYISQTELGKLTALLTAISCLGVSYILRVEIEN